MTDFFDWLTATDSGLGTDRLREQFRLSQQEMRRTTEALAPAFLFGLQRLVADPAAWTGFMRSLASLGLDDVSTGTEAVSPAATTTLLAKIFGTDALAGSIARHASMMAGVAPDTIRRMMPELALLTVQTMMRTAAAHGGLTPAGTLPSDAGGQAIADLMRRSANAVDAFSRPGSGAPAAGAPSTYLESLFADALKGSFPWMQPLGTASAPPGRQPRERSEPSAMTSPFFAFAPLLDAFSAPAPARSPSHETPAPRHASGTTEAADPLTQMSRLMQAGRSVQETYALEMLALFGRHRTDRR